MKNKTIYFAFRRTIYDEGSWANLSQSEVLTICYISQNKVHMLIGDNWDTYDSTVLDDFARSVNIKTLHLITDPKLLSGLIGRTKHGYIWPGFGDEWEEEASLDISVEDEPIKEGDCSQQSLWLINLCKKRWINAIINWLDKLDISKISPLLSE